MLLHVIARGKIGRSPEADLLARYARRIAWPLKLTELPDTGGTVPAPQPQSRTVLLDERDRHEQQDGIGTRRDRQAEQHSACLLYTSPSPRDRTRSRMPSSA